VKDRDIYILRISTQMVPNCETKGYILLVWPCLSVALTRVHLEARSIELEQGEMNLRSGGNRLKLK
jgi:hypothetical protein